MDDEPLDNTRPRSRAASVSSTTTVIPANCYFTASSIARHKPHCEEQESDQRTWMISCTPPVNAAASFASNGRVVRLPTCIIRRPNRPTGCPTLGFSLNSLSSHEGVISCPQELPEIRDLDQDGTRLPTLDQLLEYETFDDFRAHIEASNHNEEVGFLNKVAQVVGVYFCCCITSRKKKTKNNAYGERTPPPFDGSSEDSTKGTPIGNGERRARMRRYGYIIEQTLSHPAPAKLSLGSLIRVGLYGRKPHHSNTIPGGDGEIRPAQDDDVPSRSVYHPAYEVDAENPGDYAYISEGSTADATRIWRGHVR